MATPKKKPYKTVNKAAHEIARKRRTKGPQEEAYRQPSVLEQNPFGQATKLNKAKGSPKTHKDGLNQPVNHPVLLELKAKIVLKQTVTWHNSS